MTNYITYNNKKIIYTSKGSGPAIVLLHGFLEDLSMWDYFVKELSTEYRVICIDLPGFGQSDCLGEVHHMADMATVVDEVIDHLGINKCLMVGHSMGGYVTLSYAEKFPEKLSAFCLFHSHALPDSPEAKENRDRAVRVVNSDHGTFIFNFFPELFAPENVEKHRKEIESIQDAASGISPEAIIAALLGMKERKSGLDTIINTKVPVLFILGKKDPRIHFESALAQTALPAHSEVLILDHVGHMGHIEAREQTLQAVEGFARKVMNNK